MGDRIVFSRRWQTGVRAFTFVACGYTLAACLAADWDHIFGPDHVFSGVRPALRSFFNGLYGTGSPDNAAVGPEAAGGGSANGAACSACDSGSAPATGGGRTGPQRRG
jgi:hypothetical protein